jgi:hypothetical protein
VLRFPGLDGDGDVAANGIYAQPDSKMIILETVARPTGHDESGFLGCPYGSPRCFFHAAADSRDSQLLSPLYDIRATRPAGDEQQIRIGIQGFDNL